MLYRQFRKRDTGKWLDVLLTVAGDKFDVAPESHLKDRAMALGVAENGLEVLDNNSDSRTGTLIALPIDVSAPTAEQLRRTRIGEIEAIPRSDWTTAQMREMIQLVARELIGE